MPTEIVIGPQAFLRNEYVASLTDQTILIAGAGGYLGTALLSSLYSIRCRIVAVVHHRICLPPPADCDADITVRHVDLSQSSIWLDVLRETRPDVIINLAAYEHHRGSEHAPAQDLAVNTATVLELLDACRELELKPRIVQASSANIVGCPRSPLVNEDTEDHPLTLYAINKLTAEWYLRYYAETFAIPSVSLRFGNIYGPLPSRDAELESRVVLNKIVRRALDGHPVFLYRNQDCVRDFLYVEDAVRAICAGAAIKKKTFCGKYVVGSGEGRSLFEIVNEIARQVENLGRPPVEILFDADAGLEPIEWREFVADYTQLRLASGWDPQIKLREGIELTLEAFSGGESH
ncbi:MAG TPA: NAD-dependent epimerase/dehydratase family protein [Pyrinomonadaceae bacterium]|nr:NAD-dependent epimerase/dehydratase family protein [Pyrinomonadaceae bacterium]